MSVAIRVEPGINSYPEAPWSWELASTGMSWREGGFGPQDPSRGLPVSPSPQGAALWAWEPGYL